MIKRVVGIVAALAVIGVIVLTILGRGTYRSMLFEEQRAEAAQPAFVPSDSVPPSSGSPASVPAPGAETPDSLGMPAADSVRSDAGSAAENANVADSGTGLEDVDSDAAGSESKNPAADTTAAAAHSVDSAS